MSPIVAFVALVALATLVRSDVDVSKFAIPPPRCRMPIRLTRTEEVKNKDGTTRNVLVADGDALTYLRNLKGHYAIVGMSGRARSGKSFTLNHLLGVEQSRGFVVSHGDGAETLGAHAWCDPDGNLLSEMVHEAIINASLPIQNDGGSNSDTVTASSRERPGVIVIDTEGMNHGMQMHDSPVMLFIATISTQMLYHVSEGVNGDDIKRLCAVRELIEDHVDNGMLWGTVSSTTTTTTTTSHINHHQQQQQHIQNDERSQIVLPSISWIVQRYGRVTSDGGIATSTSLPSEQSVSQLLDGEYLAERPNPTGDAAIASHNFTVRTIRRAFPRHRVFVAPSAATQEYYHESLIVGAPARLLAPAYVQVMNTLRSDVVGDIARAHMSPEGPRVWYSSEEGQWPTGPDVARAVSRILEAANDGHVLVGNAVSASLSRSALTAATSALSRMLMTGAPREPVDEIVLNRMAVAAIGEARSELEKRIPQSTMRAAREDIMADFSARADAIVSDVMARNQRASDDVCAAAMRKAVAMLADDACDDSGDVAHCIHTSPAAFYRASAAAMKLYDTLAVGPARESRRVTLREAMALRGELVTEASAPRTKTKIGATCCVVAFVTAVLAFALSNVFGVSRASKTLWSTTVAMFAIGLLSIVSTLVRFPRPIDSAILAIPSVWSWVNWMVSSARPLWTLLSLAIVVGITKVFILARRSRGAGAPLLFGFKPVGKNIDLAGGDEVNDNEGVDAAAT